MRLMGSMESEFEMPDNMEKLVPDQKSDPSMGFKDPVQRGYRTEAIRPDTKVILREPMG